MILGVCGFGFSGSGAVLDWLKDYPEVYVSDKLEFSYVYKPDGLIDLGNAICYHPSRYFSSDSAIRRFIQYMNRSKNSINRMTNGHFQEILDDYISKIIQVSWKGSTSVHRYQASSIDYIFRQHIPRLLRRQLENRFHFIIKGSYWPDKTMYFSVLHEESFIRYSRSFISDIINEACKSSDKRIIVLDQCFSANDPRNSFVFFDAPKAITVIRDPRDVFLLAKKAYGFATSFIPKKRVEDFIVYYRGLMESRRYNSKDKDIVEVRFEDLIYNSVSTFTNMENRLGLSHIDVKNFTFFKPEISINNTQLWNKFPKYKKEIEIIEKELSEYLYPFYKYETKPNYFSRVF